jgi:fructokinase
MTAYRAVVVGEALVDVLHRADGSVSRSPGGSPANVAVTLGRLGVPVELITQLGGDPAGDAVRAWLAASGVTVTASRPAGGRTSTATARLDPTGAAGYEFDLDWSLPMPRVDRAASLHVGSVAALLAPGADTVERLAAGAGDALVSYDPNIRAALVTDPAGVRARVERLVALAHVVKASDDDLAFLYPGESPAGVAHRWRAAGPALVVVTSGAAGLFATTTAGDVEVAAPAVTVADTVGAGDTCMGTLIAELLALGGRAALDRPDPDAVHRVLRHCVRNAAVTVSRPGADPPWDRELDPAETLPATMIG